MANQEVMHLKNQLLQGQSTYQETVQLRHQLLQAEDHYSNLAREVKAAESREAEAILALRDADLKCQQQQSAVAGMKAASVATLALGAPRA